MWYSMIWLGSHYACDLPVHLSRTGSLQTPKQKRIEPLRKLLVWAFSGAGWTDHTDVRILSWKGQTCTLADVNKPQENDAYISRCHSLCGDVWTDGLTASAAYHVGTQSAPTSFLVSHRPSGDRISFRLRRSWLHSCKWTHVNDKWWIDGNDW